MTQSSLHKITSCALRRAIITAVQILLLCGALHPQPNGVTLLGHLNNPHGLSAQKTSFSSCWGYVAPDGREYGFISTYTGMAVIDINSDTMKEVAFIPGPTSAWCYREIKTHKNFGYIVYDYPTGGEFIGIQIVDLSRLPDTVLLVKTFLYSDSAFGNVSTSHTLSYADGFLYCNGSSHYLPGGTVIFSLKNDPTAPEFAGTYEPMYLHDTYIRNDTLYGAAITSGGGLYIADVKNKSAPVTLGKIVYSGSGTHNSWVSLDTKYAFTTDEVGGTNHDLKVWALDSLPNSVKVAEWTADPTASIHNVYGRGHYLYVSHYKAGFRALDIHDPENPVEAGFFDTYTPAVDSVPGSYAGCWAVFPYFPSGKIIASDMQTGIYLFRFDALKPRARVQLLEPPDSASSTGGFQFRWTAAADQTEDPLYYELHVRGLNGNPLDTAFTTHDTSFTNAFLLTLEAGDYLWYVTARDEFTLVTSIDTFSFHSSGSTGVGQDKQLPREFKLEQNYPNPFNPKTVIRYSLPGVERGGTSLYRVRLDLYDVLGRTVATLVDELQEPGSKSVEWNPGNAPSGVYFYRLTAGKFSDAKRLLYLR